MANYSSSQEYGIFGVSALILKSAAMNEKCPTREELVACQVELRNRLRQSPVAVELNQEGVMLLARPDDQSRYISYNTVLDHMSLPSRLATVESDLVFMLASTLGWDRGLKIVTPAHERDIEKLLLAGSRCFDATKHVQSCALYGPYGELCLPRSTSADRLYIYGNALAELQKDERRKSVCSVFSKIGQFLSPGRK